MWILPRQLHTSAFVPDTAALISDLNEQSQICAQSLFQRSKPSPVRTWSLKWKRDSWTQLLSGRILRLSHGKNFVAAWTSSQGDTRASHSQPLGSASVLKTQDTSGHIYQPELLQCDQVPVSLKMSRDISRWGCPTLSKTWQDWVIERRGAYSQRLKLARPTKEKESSSWPTANARDWKDGDGKCNQRALDAGHQNTLARAATCWPTPCAMEAEKAGKFDKGQMGQSLSALANRGELGLPAPASSSKIGNRQELWSTPRTGATDSSRPNNKGGIPLADQAKRLEAWATPRTEMDSGAHRGTPDTLHSQVKAQSTGKLNPRWVETLMGLPIGWTMPSCTSPQTIAPTSCDSSAMELCLPPQSGPSEFSFQS